MRNGAYQCAAAHYLPQASLSAHTHNLPPASLCATYDLARNVPRRYCDLSGIHGEIWTLLMRVRNDTTFYYAATDSSGASVWESAITVAADTVDQGRSSSAPNAKFAAFNTAPLNGKLLLENTDSGGSTILTPSSATYNMYTLLELMQRGSQSTAMSVVAGVSTPWQVRDSHRLSPSRTVSPRLSPALTGSRPRPL